MITTPKNTSILNIFDIFKDFCLRWKNPADPNMKLAFMFGQGDLQDKNFPRGQENLPFLYLEYPFQVSGQWSNSIVEDVTFSVLILSQPPVYDLDGEAAMLDFLKQEIARPLHAFIFKEHLQTFKRQYNMLDIERFDGDSLCGWRIEYTVQQFEIGNFCSIVDAYLNP